MPGLGSSYDPEKQRIEAAFAARDAFESGFKRSRKGNLWRNWEGKMLCVFRRDDDFYAWSVSDNDGPRFSPGGYATEEEAIGALWDQTEGGNWTCR